jgi:hypothetical protein
MIRRSVLYALLLSIAVLAAGSNAQAQIEDDGATLYDFPPRRLVDLPTAGTLPRGHFQLGLRLFTNGGGLGYADIGLSSRFMMGISFGGESVLSNQEADWNPTIEFSLKFRVVDELQYFPAITVGFSSQGYGSYDELQERYAYKSRGFYAVASRSFYFHRWTAGWHFGINYARTDRETESDTNPDITDIRDNDINFFAGFDITFNYNLALLLEYDVALNDDKSNNDFAGEGRGYLNLSVKWLFNENLELEALARDLLVNRPESDTFTREIRLTYIESF